MNIIDVERKNDEGDVTKARCAELEYAEEQQLAGAVMRLLSEENFRGKDRDFLERVYWLGRAKFMGRLWGTDLARTMDIFEHWSWRADFATPFRVPAFLEEGARRPTIGKSLYKNDGEWKGIKTMLLLIWEDAYTEHQKELVRRSDSYKHFIGNKDGVEKMMIRHPIADMEKAERAEERFWAEVERTVERTKDSRMPLNDDDAYKYVKDYVRRGRDVIPDILMRQWIKWERENEIPHDMDEPEMVEAYRYSAQRTKELVGDYTPTEIDALFALPEEKSDG
jgi:hypothetical protein